jgi:putative membrane protein
VVSAGWLYDWLKVLHIVAVISWMVGLFYLPGLFVYHADAAAGVRASETFVIMEQRLVKVIMNPAMMVSWVVGLWLAWDGFGFMGVWLWIKIAAVIGLTAFHVFLEPVGAAVRQRDESDDGAAMAHGQ